jgi:hypothetical protein
LSVTRCRSIARRTSGKQSADYRSVPGDNEFGVPYAKSHSFRKSVVTLIDDEGLSARIGADHLCHTRISMTEDKYMARGWVHVAVAHMPERAISDGFEGATVKNGP